MVFINKKNGVPGCPPIPEVIIGTLLHVHFHGELPELKKGIAYLNSDAKDQQHLMLANQSLMTDVLVQDSSVLAALKKTFGQRYVLREKETEMRYQEGCHIQYDTKKG